MTDSAFPLILIGIGANLANSPDVLPLQTCRDAIIRLDGLAGLRVVGLSRWYESSPIPPSGQPPYVNGVAHLRPDSSVAHLRPDGSVAHLRPDGSGRIDPASLLASLLAIEAACGRTRSVPNAARTLDLDLIAIGDMIRNTPDPILPHPRAHLRAFVLAPLADVAPDWVHPRLRQTARQMLSALPAQDCRPL